MNAVQDMFALESVADDLDRILSDLASLIQMTLKVDFDNCALCNAEAFAMHAEILSACHAQLMACDGRTNHAKLLNHIAAIVRLFPMVIVSSLPNHTNSMGWRT